MNNYFVILAAGKSKRFHKNLSKQLETLSVASIFILICMSFLVSTVSVFSPAIIVTFIATAVLAGFNLLLCIIMSSSELNFTLPVVEQLAPAGSEGHNYAIEHNQGVDLEFIKGESLYGRTAPLHDQAFQSLSNKMEKGELSDQEISKIKPEVLSEVLGYKQKSTGTNLFILAPFVY